MEPRSKPPAGEPIETTQRQAAHRRPPPSGLLPKRNRIKGDDPVGPHAASSRPQPRHGWSRDRFCEYLRAQRERASLSIEDIARVTKIPERSLRQLEEGRFEDLPADVFVRGFLRSYARVVGVNADDVVRRYAMCGLDPAPVASELAQVAAEQIAAMAEKDPSAGEVAVARVDAPPSSDEEEAPVAVVIDSGVDEVRTASAPVRTHGQRQNQRQKEKKRKSGRHHTRRAAAGSIPPAKAAEAPPAATVDRAVDQKPVRALAERPRRERAFLPPAWSEGETGRRGPLTLAVIILVIVATLTMSYLLRRPSYSGDGVTRSDRSAGAWTV